MKDTIRFEQMNNASFLRGKYDTAIVPVGSCESHGDHLPFGTDALIAHEMALAVGVQLDHTVVLPPTYFGFSHHYRHQAMTVTIDQDTNIRLITDILTSLAYWKFKHVLVVNGHDGNIPAIDVAARNVRLKHPEMHIAALDAWWITGTNLLPPGTFEAWNGSGHGGEGETSLALSLIPQFVNMESARGMIPELDGNVKEFWDFSEITRLGATGDPRKATKKKGDAMRDVLVNYLVGYMRERRASGWAHNPQEPK
jgi:creatinine amidohydrolase